MYRAIADAIAADVRIGTLHPGDRLPTHRGLADVLGVNVSTVTRAYKEAMYRGLISSTVGRGTYIAVDAAADLSLSSPEVQSGSGLLEMGLVTGLYGLDPEIETVLNRITARRSLSALLRYSPSEGMPEHKEAGAWWVKKYGLDVSCDRIMVFSGTQHGLSCCLLSLFRPGDRVAVEQMTYPGIKTMAAMAGLQLVPVEMDEQGMMPDALAMACRRERIKGVYLIPTVQNPTTICMPRDRREAIAGVIARNGLVLMEDDAFALTRTGMPPPVATLIPDQTIFFAGVSKMTWPGLRVCFSVVPRRYYDVLTEAVLNTIWMTPPLNGALVSELIMIGRMDDVISRKHKEAGLRNKTVREKLGDNACFGFSTGFFVWMTLDPPWTGRSFEDAAMMAGVRVFGAEKFMVGGTRLPAGVRISLTGAETLYDLSRGLDILSRIQKGNSLTGEAIL